MKAKIAILFMMILSVCSACGKGENLETKVNKSEEPVANVEQSVVLKDYVGEGGYITSNQIYDYSGIYDTVYEWCDGVKMPIEKPQNTVIKWQENEYPMWNSMYLENVSKDDMKEYVSALENEGFIVYTVSNGYRLYKDNFRVEFSYSEMNETYIVFCYNGNVSQSREVTREDAKDMIETGELLKDNEYFNEYYIFEIQNETVGEAGYYEFLIEPITQMSGNSVDNLPYYLVTDGENVLLFEQNALSMSLPSNVNLIKYEGVEELIVSGIPNGRGYDTYGTCISGYQLKDGRFEKSWQYMDSYDYPVHSWKQAVISKIEEGELKFYLLEATEGYDHSQGKKDFWKVKEEYKIEYLEINEY